MRVLLSSTLFAALVIATTTITLTDTEGTSTLVDISTQDHKKWIDLSGDPNASQNATKLSISSDHSDKAACFIAFESEDKSKWVFTGNKTVEGSNVPIKTVWCQENFNIPSQLPDPPEQ